MVPTKKRLTLTGISTILLLALFGVATAEGLSAGFNHQHRIIASAEESFTETENESTTPATSDTEREGIRKKTGRLLREKLGPRLGIFVLSMLPISELRGAMLLWAFDPATHSEVPWWQAALIALAGNLLPVIPILFLLDWIMKLLGKITIFRRFFDWLVSRARRRGGLVERYEYLGVFLFVAIPLPFTGAWTGALVSSVLRLNPWKSFLIIIMGVLTADVVVTSFVLLKWWGLLAAVIVLPALWLLSRWLEKRNTT